MKDSPKKVLVVDDIELVRVFMKDFLSLYDLDTELASNGQEAIDLWEKGDFNAILMDLEMPVMGGIEATRIIRQREREEKRQHTPIIAVSGTTMRAPHLKCTEAGMDGFIAKPMEISEVLDVLLPLVR